MTIDHGELPEASLPMKKQINKEKQKGKLNVYPLIYNSIE